VRGLAALVLLASVAAYPVVAGHRLVGVLAVVGATGCGALVLALVLCWWPAVAWGVVLCGAEYAVFLRLRADEVDPRAPLVAAGLVVAAELGFSSIAPPAGRAARRVVLDELIALLASAMSATLVAGVVLVAAGSATAGLFLEAAGAAAAVAAVALVVRVAARTRQSTS
jgi:hypothetical protein